jgi:glycosyltransferase involved in cell wall biosynthesis
VKKTFRKKIIESLHLNGERKIVTYPVRVIRRKNIGELILLSELFREEATFLVTLPPKNPVEIKPYERWKAFCKENEITNIHFEVGQRLEFEDLISGSDFCITTSIREGFGMAFMEPWLYNTPVTGRDIPYITKDFIDKGMDFKNLYNEICLPDIEQDFKDLDEYEQMDYILTLKSNTAKIQRVMDFNKKLGNILIPVGSDIIEKNKNLIEKHYSLRNYGQKLMEAYKGFFI